MSVSNESFEDSNFESSDESRGEDTDFHVSNKIKSSNSLDLNDRADFTDSETNIYSYNQDSRGGKNEARDYRNQMIDLPKLLRQLSLARVVLKRLPISTEATKLRITDDLAPVDVGIVDQDIDVNPPRNAHIPPSKYIDDAEFRADSVAIGETCDIVDDAEEKFADKKDKGHRQRPTDLIKRYCPKCKMLIANAGACKKQSCAKCETPLSYQCTRCDEQYSKLSSLFSHLDRKCNAQNLVLKCSKCDYRTHARTLMSTHLNRCLNGINLSCGLCEYTAEFKKDLLRHMRTMHKDKPTITSNRQRHAYLTKRYCPKCKMIIVDASSCIEQSCAKCETPLSYQCARCSMQYSNYTNLFYHLATKCNTQNLDLKCPKCDYRTHAKSIMCAHMNICLSGINFSCELCEYTTRRKTDLRRHMKTIHRDISKFDCSQCKSKPSKCEQCKIMVPVCKTCHTGFSSTDRFQEHQKSCKQPVLECKYCPYKTDDNSKFRKHIQIEHMMA